MSMVYCADHHHHYDSDYEEGCMYCQEDKDYTLNKGNDQTW